MFTFVISYADGDDFSRRFTSTVHVDAASALDARLCAEQMIYTPMVGKPDHIQIVGVTRV